MLRSFILVALRNLKRNKLFSLLNIAGLAIGLASAILILLWIRHESGFNSSYKNGENIFQVMSNRVFNDEIVTNTDVAFPVAKGLQDNFPEVELATVTGNEEEKLFSFNHKSLRQKTLTVSSAFTGVFSLDYIKGNKSALNEPNSVIITESLSKALFGNEESLNKIIRIDNKQDALVTAVIRDIPSNSTLQFSALVPFDYSDRWISQIQNDWVNSFFRVFIKTRKTVNTELLNPRLTKMISDHVPAQNAGFFIHPMKKWHLYSEFKDGKNTGGMIEYVRLFSIIAVIILFIACINFMNLSTARSNKRAREVGIRKTIGSNRKTLFIQFLTESVLLATLSLILSVGIVYLVLPWFNDLIGSKLIFNLFDTEFLLIILSTTLVTGILAGSYPAFYLSSFSPVRVLKGIFQPGKFALQPRKFLVTGQFIISILLISATIVIYLQIDHVKNRHLGYTPNNLVMIRSSPETDKHFESIRSELRHSGVSAMISRSTSPVTNIYNYTAGLEWKGMPADNKLVIAATSCDAGYFETVNAKFIEGRDFLPDTQADSTSMILNRAAVTIMGLTSPVGTEIRYGKRKFNVIGVTENIVMASPYKPVDPMMTLFNNKRSAYTTIRLNQQVPVQAAISIIGTVFNKYNPGYPFEYQFADEQFNKKFLTEDLIRKLTNVFAALAIFICCLGLFGLAAYTAEQRTREIGIRKVLGADVKSVIILLSGDFLKLVVLAALIAFPIAWWTMNSWLEGYVYRISISWWVFAVAGLSAVFIAMVTVSAHALKAAVSNPVKSLRAE